MSNPKNLVVNTDGVFINPAPEKIIKGNNLVCFTFNSITLFGGTALIYYPELSAENYIICGIDIPSLHAGALYVTSRTNGTGFTINSTNYSDTSTIWYSVLK